MARGSRRRPHRLIIQRPLTVDDDAGQVQHTWESWIVRRSSRQPAGGDETETNDRTRGVQLEMFEVPADVDSESISSEMRVILDRKSAWQIRHVTTSGEGRQRVVQLRAEREEKTKATALTVALVPEPTDAAANNWSTMTVAEWDALTSDQWATVAV